MKQAKSVHISPFFGSGWGWSHVKSHIKGQVTGQITGQTLMILAAVIAGIGNVSVLLDQGQVSVQIGASAIARSSGGVSGGGSFQQRPAPQPYNPPQQSRPRSTQPYSPPRYNQQPSYTQPYNQRPYYPPPVYIPRSDYNNQYNNQPYNRNTGTVAQSGFNNMFPGLLLLLILGGGGIAAILWLLPKLTSRTATTPAQEIANNTFTVTKVQVALVAQAREIQERLSSLTTEVDTSTPEGLMRLLQESALALLRHTESWTHFAAESQVARDALSAEQIFNRYTIDAKSVLSTETLVNENGRGVQRRDLTPAGMEEDPAAYIVVTLLVGTAHDNPLFEKIQAIAELKALLEQLAALPPQYLMTFKLIWSPQDASDSLSADELLTEYSDLVLL